MLWIFRTFSSSILVNLSCFYVCTHLSSFICISHMCHHFNSYPILMSLRLSGGQLKTEIKTVREKKPHSSSRFSTTLLEGEKKKMLECRAKGEPTPSISWWRDGNQVPPRHHHLWPLLLLVERQQPAHYLWLFQVDGSGTTMEIDTAGWWGCRWLQSYRIS